MDEHGLPIVGSGVDYTKVPALERKNTLVYLNKFIIHTTQFLNRFSTVCEEKLLTLSQRIQRLDISLNILEAKLSSIPDLDGIQATTQYTPPEPLASAGSSSASGSTSTSGAPPASSSGPPPPSSSSQPGPSSNAPPTSSEPIPPPEPEPEPAQASKGRKAKDDPRYQKFFKMKRLGVNPLQIAMEMKRHGLNPDIIEDEDAELPDEGGASGGGGGGGGVDAAFGNDDSNSSTSDSSSEESDDSFESD